MTEPHDSQCDSGFKHQLHWRADGYRNGDQSWPMGPCDSGRALLHFLPHCMEYRRGLAIRILSGYLSVCLSNAWFF